MAQLQRVVVQTGQLTPPTLALTQAQTHYLQRVLRLRQGDRFIALDGQGAGWLAVLVECDRAGARAELLEPIHSQTELPIRVRLIAALPKGNGFDDVVRQLTELGVGDIFPVTSDRTLLEPSGQKLERWQRIAQEATEQSERWVVPTIHPIQSLLQALGGVTADSRYFCEARGELPDLLSHYHAVLASSAARPSSVALAIGPEGGWSEAEITAAIASGYIPVQLGRRILRAVTAPMVAVTLVGAAIEADPGYAKA